MSVGDRLDDLIHYAIKTKDAIALWQSELNLGARLALTTLVMFSMATIAEYRASRQHVLRASHDALQQAIGVGVYLGSERRLNLNDPALNGLTPDSVTIRSRLERRDLLRIATEDVRGRRCDATIVIDGPRTHPAGRRCDLRSTK